MLTEDFVFIFTFKKAPPIFYKVANSYDLTRTNSYIFC